MVGFHIGLKFVWFGMGITKHMILLYYGSVSLRVISGLVGRHGLAVACGHVQVSSFFLSHIKEKSVLKACKADIP